LIISDIFYNFLKALQWLFCIVSHRAKNNLMQLILFRKCVDMCLNVFCSFVLLQAFPWIAFFSFVYWNCFLYNFFPLPRTIIYDVFFFRKFPFQELSHLMWWNLFRFVLFKNDYIRCQFFSESFLVRNFHTCCVFFQMSFSGTIIFSFQ
jgi:hypothetical protein